MKKKIAEINLEPKERKAIKEFSKRIKKSLGKRLLRILLFGSKARGDFHVDSDIDVFIVTKKSTVQIISKIGQVTADIFDEFDVLISPVAYSEYEEQRNLEMHSFFFEDVYKEGIAL
ncbi:MAG: nucleotidyltransferase domain-containing protein [Ignavibacteriae bacterium]|nr:nucleotidyltransferase domain-containing protein [Ignavibacteriota bacterium]